MNRIKMFFIRPALTSSPISLPRSLKDNAQRGPKHAARAIESGAEELELWLMDAEIPEGEYPFPYRISGPVSVWPMMDVINSIEEKHRVERAAIWDALNTAIVLVNGNFNPNNIEATRQQPDAYLVKVLAGMLAHLLGRDEQLHRGWITQAQYDAEIEDESQCHWWA